MNNEPVAWMKIDEVLKHFDSVGCGTIYKADGEGRVPVYTHPANTEDEGKVCARCGAIAYDPVITQTAKTLTDEEINVVAILHDAEIVPVGHEIWKTSEEFNKYKKIVLATARAILKKASEK